MIQAKNMRTYAAAAVLVTAGLVAGSIGCARAEQLSGKVKLDGSSTVFPISEAVAEEFLAENPRVQVTVGISGTGGGFKKFCVGEIDISDASRPIKETEVECAKEHGIEYVELPVAYDGLSILVNPANDFAESLTVAQLEQLWSRNGKARKWSDLDPAWPEREIKLYGPGTDSGTFDYFVEAVLGKDGQIRPDFTASEDDNILVQGISGDRDALGFFGFAYYVENQDKLKALAIDGGKGPVAPTEVTINNGTYAPLSRPIFIYAGVKAAERPEVKKFVEFYLEHAAALASEVGYIALPEDAYDLAKARFADRKTGSAFASAEAGQSITSVMKAN